MGVTCCWKRYCIPCTQHLWTFMSDTCITEKVQHIYGGAMAKEDLFE